MEPDPRGKLDFRICDPACGTGGFLVCSYEWLVSKEVSGGVFDRADARRIKSQTFIGQDLVPRPLRLALMNLFLHGVEPHIYLGDTIYEPERGDRFDVILTNPPFGTKGANQAPDRDDFTIETSNRQLNFVQHVLSTLKPGGRAAMVLPDNCLFEGKAGEVFEILMQDCNLHTVLRLPRGTRSEEHTSELQSLTISYAVFCLKKKRLYVLSRLRSVARQVAFVSYCVSSTPTTLGRTILTHPIHR